MPNRLSWCDLPSDVSLWPGLPLSLSGDEVMPLDYRAGHSGWVLYGTALNKQRLTEYQHGLGAALVIVSAWSVGDYQVVRLAGSLTPRATKLAHANQLDVAPLGKLPTLLSPGLLVMDMDSTAIQIECIDEIARLAGCGDKVADITERAMRGELDFRDSLVERVAALAGTDATILDKVLADLVIMPGLDALVGQLKIYGWHLAIASGGFTYFADHLKFRFELTAAFANQLGIANGKLTGELVGDIIDAKAKANILECLAAELGIARQQTVAIGDGANDLPMIKAAGLGIAYHAKPKVNDQSEVSIRFADLHGVLCTLTGCLNHEPR